MNEVDVTKCLKTQCVCHLVILNVSTNDTPSIVLFHSPVSPDEHPHTPAHWVFHNAFS